MHIYAYFWQHILCISLAYLTNTVCKYFLCLCMHISCIVMHISARSIPLSVAGFSCTIPASSTTGSCALFIARKLMHMLPRIATPGRLPGGPASSCLPGPPQGLAWPPPCPPYSRSRPSASSSASCLESLIIQ